MAFCNTCGSAGAEYGVHSPDGEPDLVLCEPCKIEFFRAVTRLKQEYNRSNDPHLVTLEEASSWMTTRRK